MPRKNGVKTVKVQLTVDETTDRVLEKMVSLGIHVPNKAEVASWILRTWICSSQEQLSNYGIELVENAPKSTI